MNRFYMKYIFSGNLKHESKTFRRVFIMLTMETLLHNQLFTRSVRKFENRFISIGFNFD